MVSAVSFGGAGPFAKPLIEAGIGSLHTVWLRMAGAAVVLAPLAIRRRRSVRAAPWLLLAYGLFPVAGAQGCYFVAINRIPVGVALLIEYFGPVLVLGWTRIVRRRRVSRRAAAGAAISVCGLALVVEIWSGAAFDPVGVLFALGAAACQASYFLLSAHEHADLDPATVIAYGLLVGAVVMAVITQVWTLPWWRLAHTVDVGGHGHLPALSLLAYVVLVSTVAAYLTGVLAVRRLSPPVASVVGTLEAVVAVLVAWVVLGESLGPSQLVGGAVVLAGALLAQTATPTAPVPETFGEMP